jgi:hypothetical protein
LVVEEPNVGAEGKATRFERGSPDDVGPLGG